MWEDVLTPDWVFCDSGAGGDLPWRSEVLSQGRALWGNGGRKAQESLAGGQTAAHQTSLLCPSFVSLLCTLTLGPVCVPRPLGFLKTCCTIKTSWWGSWTLRGKGGRPLGTVFPGLRGRKGCLSSDACPRRGSELEGAGAPPSIQQQPCPPRTLCRPACQSGCSPAPKSAEFNTPFNLKNAGRQRSPFPRSWTAAPG